jgi:hypothetical protein
MANYKTGAERYNDRARKIFEDAKRLERERLERGEMPNPSLTSPEDARKYGWNIVGREVTKILQDERASAEWYSGITEQERKLILKPFTGCITYNLSVSWHLLTGAAKAAVEKSRLEQS